jgi:hypothetical protein
MANDVQICSNALILIGHHAISALSEDERVEALYPTTYKSALTKHAWNFAKRKAQLSQLVTGPLNEYKYAYQLPSDLLLLKRTYPSTNYKIFEDQLWSNDNKVEIDYVFMPAEQALPDYFVEYMEFILASKFAIPITSNKATAQEYREAAKDQLRIAKFLDSQSAPQDPPSDQPFISARSGG